MKWIDKSGNFAANVITVDDMQVINPTEEHYKHAGYSLYVEPHYKSAFSRQIHIGGALAALFAGIGWCLTVNIWPTVIISSLYLLYFVFMGEYKYYIGEVLALLDIYITVLIS